MRSPKLYEKDYNSSPINPNSPIGKIIIGSMIIAGAVIFGIRDKIFTKTLPGVKEKEKQHNEFHLPTKYENQIPKDYPKYQEDDDGLNEEGNLSPELEKLRDKAKIFFDEMQKNNEIAEQARRSIEEQLDVVVGTMDKISELSEGRKEQQSLEKNIKDSFFQMHYTNLNELISKAFDIAHQNTISEEDISNLINAFNLSQLFELYDIYKSQNSAQSNNQIINFIIDNARETMYDKNYNHGNLYLE